MDNSEVKLIDFGYALRKDQEATTLIDRDYAD
jgi:hypothetical protein